MPDLPTYASPSGRTIGPDEVAARTFPNARKGLDAEAVRRFLAEVADQLRDLRLERDDLRRRLAEAEQTLQAPPPPPPERDLDEATLAAIVGTETGRVLQVAHEAAHDLVTKAEQRAEELLSGVQSQLEERKNQAEAEAAAALKNATDEAEAIHERAKESGRAMVQEAREARRRILADLADRRRSLHLQLEQIRAGKESLVEIVDSVATSVTASIEAVRSRLHGADAEARDAAEGVSTVDLDQDDDDLEALVADALVNLPPAPENDAGATESSDQAMSIANDTRSDEVAERPIVSAIFDAERPDDVIVAPPKLPPAVSSASTVPTGARPADLSVTEITGVGTERPAGGDQESDEQERGDQKTGPSGESGEAASDDTSTESPSAVVVSGQAAVAAGASLGTADIAPTEAALERESIAVTPENIAPGAQQDSESAVQEIGSTAVGDPSSGGDPEPDPEESGDGGAAVKVAGSEDEVKSSNPAGSPTGGQEAGSDHEPAEDVDTDTQENPVDALFARIRASRASEVADAHRVLDAPSAVDAPPPDRRRPSAARRGSAMSTAVLVKDEDDAAIDGPVDLSELTSAGSQVRLDVAPLERRSQLIAPAVAELSRSLKRVLRMEQNDLLDRLRNTAKNGDPRDLLPGEATAKRLVESAFSGVTLAYRAGGAFFNSSTGAASPADSTRSVAAARTISGELAEEVRGLLYHRLEPALSASGDDGVDYPGVVNTAFREWKGARVESLAGDIATRAFAQAIVDGARAKRLTLTWVVDDGDLRCPDCDDNAVAGPQSAGTAFPTGHFVPPVHPGCRCLLVPNNS